MDRLNPTLKSYVQFLSPESNEDDVSIEEVKSRNPREITVPKDSFGFRFFDLLTAVVNYGGKSIPMVSEELNESPTYYYGGKIYTLAQIKRQFPMATMLIHSVENSPNKKAIKCRTGGWYLFEKTDIFIKGI